MSKKRRKSRFAAKLPIIVLLIVLLAAMFSFSSQDAAQSSALSGKVVQLLARLGINASEHFVRKAAHFSEFAVLGLLVSCLIPSLAALPACALVAMADEYHQTFVSDRAGMWQDVLLDTAGALAGIVFVWALGRLFSRKRKAR